MTEIKSVHNKKVVTALILFLITGNIAGLLLTVKVVAAMDSVPLDTRLSLIALGIVGTVSLQTLVIPLAQLIKEQFSNHSEHHVGK